MRHHRRRKRRIEFGSGWSGTTRNEVRNETGRRERFGRSSNHERNVVVGKHKGACQVDGVTYFTCVSPSTSASFLKPSKLVRGTTLLSALKDRYECEEKDTSDERLIRSEFDGEKGSEVRSFEVKLVGVEKIKKRQKLDVLKRVSLESSAVSFREDKDERALSEVCPNVTDLHVPETLVGRWTDVSRVVSELPSLRLLNLSQNRLTWWNTPSPRSDAFKRLTVLILNRTGTTWSKMCALERGLPNLQELHLCGNGLTTLALDDEDGASRRKMFEKLRVADFSDNKLRWSAVETFGLSVSNLEQLVLNDTLIATISSVDKESRTPRTFFHSLRAISLCGGGFSEWTSIDALNRRFKSLTSLKFQRQPNLLKLFGPRQQRQQLIARLENLRQLNSSDVRVRERVDAEKIYIKSTLSDAVASEKKEKDGGDAEDEESRSWPESIRKLLSVSTRRNLLRENARILELITRHGLPPSLRAGANRSGGERIQGMVSLVLRSMATVSISKEPRSQRLPIRMRIGDVKRLCARLLKVDASRQILKYREADDFAVPTDLDDDASTLAYYGVADGGTIFIHDSGDKKHTTTE